MNNYLRNELVTKLCFLADEHKAGTVNSVAELRDLINAMLLEYLEKASK